jgi:hypothetical protein
MYGNEISQIAMLVNIQVRPTVSNRPITSPTQKTSRWRYSMDPVCPCKLAFVGDEEAKRFALLYGGTWIEHPPTLEDELMCFWDLAL